MIHSVRGYMYKVHPKPVDSPFHLCCDGHLVYNILVVAHSCLRCVVVLVLAHLCRSKWALAHFVARLTEGA